MNDLKRNELRKLFFIHSSKATNLVLEHRYRINSDINKNLQEVADEFIDKFIVAIPEKRQKNP